MAISLYPTSTTTAEHPEVGLLSTSGGREYFYRITEHFSASFSRFSSKVANRFSKAVL